MDSKDVPISGPLIADMAAGFYHIELTRQEADGIAAFVRTTNAQARESLTGMTNFNDEPSGYAQVLHRWRHKGQGGHR